MTRGLLADGVGTVVGGIFNTFPCTSFSQNVGLLGITGVRSRRVTAVGGVTLLAFGLFPKMGTILHSGILLATFPAVALNLSTSTA